jgi:hypothetical protein
MMGLLGCPETCVSNYWSTLRNIPEEKRSHLNRGESLKSRIEFLFVQDQKGTQKKYSNPSV